MRRAAAQHDHRQREREARALADADQQRPQHRRGRRAPAAGRRSRTPSTAVSPAASPRWSRARAASAAPAAPPGPPSRRSEPSSRPAVGAADAVALEDARQPGERRVEAPGLDREEQRELPRQPIACDVAHPRAAARRRPAGRLTPRAAAARPAVPTSAGSAQTARPPRQPSPSALRERHRRRPAASAADADERGACRARSSCRRGRRSCAARRTGSSTLPQAAPAAASVVPANSIATPPVTRSSRPAMIAASISATRARDPQAPAQQRREWRDRAEAQHRDRQQQPGGRAGEVQARADLVHERADARGDRAHVGGDQHDAATRADAPTRRRSRRPRCGTACVGRAGVPRAGRLGVHGADHTSERRHVRAASAPDARRLVRHGVAHPLTAAPALRAPVAGCSASLVALLGDRDRDARDLPARACRATSTRSASST